MTVIYPNNKNIFLSPDATWKSAEEDINDVSKWWLEFKEFENVMPDIEKIKAMCELYPSLDKAFEQFKMVYNIVKDDYEAKHKDG